MIRYQKGHKNSKGEKAEWVIVSHKTGKVLSSHKTKEKAKEHLQQMHIFKESKSFNIIENLYKFLKKNDISDIADICDYDGDFITITLKNGIELFIKMSVDGLREEYFSMELENGEDSWGFYTKGDVYEKLYDLAQNGLEESMKLNGEISFEVKEDGIYVGDECITLKSDDFYADKRETITIEEVLPESRGHIKCFVLDPDIDRNIVQNLYKYKDIKFVKRINVYKDFQLIDCCAVVRACVGDWIRDISYELDESYINENEETLWQRQEKIDEWKDNVAVYLDRAFGREETDRIMQEYHLVLINLYMNGLDDEQFAADFIEDDINNFNGKYNDKNIKNDSKAWNEFIKKIHNITHRGLEESYSVNKLLGEKRTVTKNYDVYTYDELSDEAKERVKEKFEKVRSEDGDIFDDDCGTILNDLFPNSDLHIQYSLSYSQGDGFNTYGTLDIDDLINVDLSKYPLNKSRIKPLENKKKIKKVCDKAGISWIKLEENHRYCYSLADRINLSDVDTDELSDTDNELLDKLLDFASEVMEFINSKLEENGYKWFYEFDEDDVIEWVNANDYEFTEDGELSFD